LEALKQLRDRAAEKDLNPQEVLKESKLWTYIQRAKDSAEVIHKILEIYQTPVIASAIMSVELAIKAAM
jgi:hypothetical protein